MKYQIYVLTYPRVLHDVEHDGWYQKDVERIALRKLGDSINGFHDELFDSIEEAENALIEFMNTRKGNLEMLDDFGSLKHKEYTILPFGLFHSLIKKQ